MVYILIMAFIKHLFFFTRPEELQVETTYKDFVVNECPDLIQLWPMITLCVPFTWLSNVLGGNIFYKTRDGSGAFRLMRRYHTRRNQEFGKDSMSL